MLPKSQRLRSGRDFRRVYSQGRSYVHPALVLYVLPNGGADRRIGFSVSKKLGDAVQRNRLKRRLREACRSRVAGLLPGFDAVFVARSRAQNMPLGELDRVAGELFGRARLVAPPDGQETPQCGETSPS